MLYITILIIIIPTFFPIFITVKKQGYIMIKLLTTTALFAILPIMENAYAITAVEIAENLAVPIDTARRMATLTPYRDTEQHIIDINNILVGRTYGIDLRKKATDDERRSVYRTILTMHLYKNDMGIPAELFNNLLHPSNLVYYNHLATLSILHQAANIVANSLQRPLFDQLAVQVRAQLSSWSARSNIDKGFKDHLTNRLKNPDFISRVLGSNFMALVEQLTHTAIYPIAPLNLNTVFEAGRPIPHMAPAPVILNEPEIARPNAPLTANQIPMAGFKKFMDQEIFMDEDFLPSDIKARIDRALQRPNLTWEELQEIINSPEHSALLQVQFDGYVEVNPFEFLNAETEPQSEKDYIETAYIEQLLNGSLLNDQQVTEIQSMQGAPLTWFRLGQILQDHQLLTAIRYSFQTPQPEIFDPSLMQQHLTRAERAFRARENGLFDETDLKDLQRAVAYIQLFAEDEAKNYLNICEQANIVIADYEQAQRERDEIERAIALSKQQGVITESTTTTTTSSAAKEQPEVQLTGSETFELGELFKTIIEPFNAMLKPYKDTLSSLKEMKCQLKENLETPHLDQTQQAELRQQLDQVIRDISLKKAEIVPLEKKTTAQAKEITKDFLTKALVINQKMEGVKSLQSKMRATTNPLGQARLERELDIKQKEYTEMCTGLDHQMLKIAEWLSTDKMTAALELYGIE
jgi:hypothetical protein